MSEQINTSIVVKQRGLFLGYKVSATLWIEGEFEPLVETSQWSFTRKKARLIANRYIMAIDAIRELQEIYRAGI